MQSDKSYKVLNKYLTLDNHSINVIAAQIMFIILADNAYLQLRQAHAED